MMERGEARRAKGRGQALILAPQLLLLQRLQLVLYRRSPGGSAAPLHLVLVLACWRAARVVRALLPPSGSKARGCAGAAHHTSAPRGPQPDSRHAAP